MSETHEPTLLHRLRYTPLRDLLRLRLTGRLDWTSIIAEARLPDPIEQTLIKLIRRTRLWGLEKLEIAQELVAHFQDALEAEQPEQHVIEQFGDPSRAARLIRRATKRKRPLVWHIWRYAFWCVVALIGLYTAMGVYYFTGSRNIAVDYASVLNAEAEAIPEDQRAWPVVRRAMLAMGYTQPTAEPAEGQPDVYKRIAQQVRPAEDDWQAVASFLDQHEGSLADLRRAAGMPGLGFVAGYGTDLADLPLFEPGKSLQEHQSDAMWLEAEHADEPPMVWMLELPHLSSLRSAGRVLSVDTFRAMDAGEVDTAYDNLIAMLGLADHADEQNTLVNQLVTLSIRQLMYRTLSEAVVSYPSVFSHEQLTGLIHRIARVRDDKLSFDGEHDFMRDLIQHLYTDNGRGNGHLDARAWRRIAAELASSGQSDQGSLLPAVVGTAVSPAAVMVVADRKDLTAMVDRLYTLYQAELSLPMWDQPESVAEAQINAFIGSSIYQRTRYFPVAMAMPALGAVRMAAERHTAEADGVLTGLALELYKLDHGEYPKTLDNLVPRYVPSVPIDRITGGPLCYRPGGDPPVVYSVGADRDDDEGKIVYDRAGDRDGDVIRWVLPDGEEPIDGDWVVWPLYNEPSETD